MCKVEYVIDITLLSNRSKKKDFVNKIFFDIHVCRVTLSV